ncbi:hypothetical protein RGQ21_26370 [Kitasatospora aureofaciens]|nr:hypothetical protein RGQ21_26370 [Kitasatospora aureofaciens]
MVSPVAAQHQLLNCWACIEMFSRRQVHSACVLLLPPTAERSGVVAADATEGVNSPKLTESASATAHRRRLRGDEDKRMDGLLVGLVNHRPEPGEYDGTRGVRRNREPPGAGYEEPGTESAGPSRPTGGLVRESGRAPGRSRHRKTRPVRR